MLYRFLISSCVDGLSENDESKRIQQCNLLCKLMFKTTIGSKSIHLNITLRSPTCFAFIRLKGMGIFFKKNQWHYNTTAKADALSVIYFLRKEKNADIKMISVFSAFFL